MARRKSQAFPVGILLLALAASAAVLVYLVFSPAAPDSAGSMPDSVDNTGGSALEFEFYDRLRQGQVEVNSPAGEPDQPGPAEVERLAEQLNPDARTQFDIATETLEQIAETIAAGLEAPAPDQVAMPEPAPPVPAEPRAPAEIVLAAPAPADASGRSGTVLQSGAFRQQELALSELERQRNLGLEVEIRERPGQNGPMFLLQSGPYGSPDRLEEAEMVFRLHDIATARLPTP